MTAVAVAVLLGLLGGLAVRRRFAPVRIESSSMQPTLHPGQRVLVRRLNPPIDGVRRGDVLVLDSPQVGRVIAKRAIGLPGELVDIDPDGRVSVDGRTLAEPYVARPAGPAGTFRVPDDALLVLGDNRTRSSDSRTWLDPYVPGTAVFGRIITTPRTGWRTERG